MNLQTTIQNNKSLFLRRVLQANGIFSGLSGVIFVTGAEPLATFLGLNMPTVLAATGVALILFAFGLFYVASQERLNHKLVITIIILDVAWVIDSWVLLLTGWVPFTTGGKWAVAIVADIVAIFAALQFYALRRSQKAG